MRTVVGLFIYFLLCFPSVADDFLDCLKGNNVSWRIAACSRSLNSNLYGPYQRAHLLTARANLYSHLGRYQQAATDYQLAQQSMLRANRIGRESQFEHFLFIASINAAYSYRALGQLKAAKNHASRALFRARRMNSKGYIK